MPMSDVADIDAHGRDPHPDRSSSCERGNAYYALFETRESELRVLHSVQFDVILTTFLPEP